MGIADRLRRVERTLRSGTCDKIDLSAMTGRQLQLNIECRCPATGRFDLAKVAALSADDRAELDRGQRIFLTASHLLSVEARARDARFFEAHGKRLIQAYLAGRQ